MSRTQWIIVATLLGIAVVAAVVGLVASGSWGSPKEPLVEPSGAGNMAFGMPDDVGKSVSVSGPFVLENTSNRTLVLTQAALAGTTTGIALRGAYVLRLPGHPPYILSAYGYRVPSDGHLLHGATVAPHTKIAVVLGVTATAPGRHTWGSVEITYGDGDATYVGHYGLAGRICAPKARYWKKNGCPIPPLSPPGSGG